MTQFFIFTYAMLAMFVIQVASRAQREQRQTHQMVTLVGWGLFSLSSTLSLLFAAVAVALALGLQMPLDGLEAALS